MEVDGRVVVEGKLRNNQGDDYPPEDEYNPEDGEEQGLREADIEEGTEEQQEETTTGPEGGGDDDTVTGEGD